MIFLSWSGELSRQIALALREWFGEVFESLEVWVSDVDIDLGARAVPTIDANLDRAIGAILVLTVTNQSAPWVNFEAGALSRQLQGNPRSVIPLLVDADDIGQLKSPLSAFQGALLTREGVEKVVSALFELQGKDPRRAGSRMDAYWPILESRIGEIRSSHLIAPIQKPLPSTQDLEDHLNRIERLIAAGPVPARRVDGRLRLLDLEEEVRRRLAEIGLTLEYWGISSKGGVLAGIPGCEADHRAIETIFDTMKSHGIYSLVACTEDYPRVPREADDRGRRSG